MSVSEQLQDILRKRADQALEANVIGPGVIELCAALAAQEHGDARCALDLLRISTEKAEFAGEVRVNQGHVRAAQSQVEADQMNPVLATLPTQQKLVLAAILLNEKNGLRNVATGQVYDIYRQACQHIRQNPLTQRRISGLISNLDMLGLITARTVSKGRYGRSKEINSCIPGNVNPIEIMVSAEEDLSLVFDSTYQHQSSL